MQQQREVNWMIFVLLRYAWMVEVVAAAAVVVVVAAQIFLNSSHIIS